MRDLSLAIVGAAHPNKRGPSRRFDIALCKAGDPLELRREPKNKTDPYAVAVYSERNVQLGYLTAERAPWIGGMLAQSREIVAVFQGPATFGGWARVAFDGAVPELPPAPAPPIVRDESGFWPDDIPPDE